MVPTIKNLHANCAAASGDNADVCQHTTKKLAVNLRFNDVTYELVPGGKNSKIVLNGVSGVFRAGELSAIMGPSGCGKTTLLNLLCGYRIRKTSGSIRVNDKPMNPEMFRKISRYVLQDDNISPHFTVWEMLMLASHFKLDRRCTKVHRQEVVSAALATFQLTEQSNTFISRLSGGQRKRVSIALESLDEPAVLFLDEPTTGLDEFSAAQCIRQLEILAKSGRTIICSIHTPSARLLEMFDKLYVLAESRCIYQGAVAHVVPYLARLNLHCPLSYNPADFLLEVSTNEYGNYLKELVREIDNGKITNWLPDRDNIAMQESQIKVPALVEHIPEDDVNWTNYGPTSKCSWWSEFMLIYTRHMKLIWRDKFNLLLRVIPHLVLSVIIGLAYLGVGDNGKFGLYNYHLSIMCVVLCIFVAMMPMISCVPQEMLYLRKEHFNQWYRLSSYFMALLTAQLPLMAVTCFVSSGIIYALSNQPMQLYRFLMFFGIMFLSLLAGISYGLLIGSRFSLLNALFIGPCIVAVWSQLAIYPTNKDSLSVFETILVLGSFMRHSLEGIMTVLLKLNRPDITCPTKNIVCPYSKPGYVLKTAGSTDINYMRSVSFLVAFYIAFALLAFINLNSRLSASQYLEKSRHYRFVKYLLKKYLYFKLF